jgi:pimeloyl-ACP methyl ester carboxylesterase
MRPHSSLLFVTVLVFYCSRAAAAFSGFKLPWELPLFTSLNSSSTTQSTVKEQEIDLKNGISAQVLSSFPTKTTKQQPPLVFLHGSMHGSWCWAEKFFPHFTSLGYPVVALSWRGTGGTFAGEGVKKVKAAEHCQDLQGFLNELPTILGPKYAKKKPVLISHSFGGICVMKFLENCGKKPLDQFSGIISICSVPPSGNGRMTMRFLRRSLSDSWKITAGFAMKKCIQDASLCRELFFGGEPKVLEDGSVDDFGVSDEDIQRYQGYFARDTTATIDLMDLAKSLPSKKTDKKGRAPFVNDLPPCLVMAGTDDFVVDPEANLETAKYYGLEEPVFVDSPHDVMLGRKWQNAADTIHNWVQENVRSNKV